MRLLKRAAGAANRPATVLDVMTPNPKSISENTTLRECAEAMRQRGIHTAPVIDDAGRPIGVISRSDIVEYWTRERNRSTFHSGPLDGQSQWRPKQPGDDATARDLMNPVVFDVHQSTPIARVVEKLLALEVRCLFVTDEQGVLIGAVSVFDVLRHIAGNVENTEIAPAAPWELPVELQI